MDRLEQLISDLEYITNSLRALREIHASGSCNDCKQKSLCEYEPDWGERVRYNCPFYVGRLDDTEDGPRIDGGTVVDFTLYLCKKVQEHRPEGWDLIAFIRDTSKQFIEEYGE